MIPFFDFDKLCILLALEGQENLALEERKSRVSFSKQTDVVLIPSAKYLTKKEKNDLWYPEPVKKSDMHHKAHLLMCAITSRKENDDGGQAEAKDAEEEKNKLPLSVCAVLEEQKSQREEGCTDPDVIAKMYRQCSAYSAVRAQMRAEEDQYDAFDYLSTKTPLRRRNLISIFRNRAP
jgi:hypothetical protein